MRFSSVLRKRVRKILSRLGYDIIKKANDHDSWTVSRSMRGSLLNLVELGLDPKCVVDVGVGNGTYDLYESFPDAFHLLVEPLKEFENPITTILSEYTGVWINAAAMDEDGELTINIHPSHLEGSSIFKESIGEFADGAEREVNSRRLDSIISQHKLSGPFIIKVDVQGAEKCTLDGAGSILDQTEVIILEVSMFNFLVGSPIFIDIAQYMDSLGFVVYDIFGLSYRPLDNALAQVDLVFVKESGQFRQHHIFSSPEEFKETYAKNHSLDSKPT